ncbi:hypothetical protein HFP57_17295 [Parasphingopyxis algicola]|uniref:hypothetical protein n=1 Tax=Parasphingopyxis algicola TaxID=2026624 RepID=UPI0015A3024D|nr:hypothetical protein [Parasphingopyxis algicola]QLC26617.1 hypothetical protein HFP57_17295 [Parasphingopyxis algicola]
MTTSDRILAQADELLRRVSPQARELARRQRQRRQQAFLRRLRRGILIAIVAIVGMTVTGLFLGSFGFAWMMLTLLVTFFVLVGVLISGREPAVTQEKLMESELPALPSNTEQWLAKQRLALPAPANRKLDAIAVRLEELRPQLANLDPREPAAVEVRRLVGVELPELVEGYKRVPDHLRRDPSHGGRTPEKQLVEGLDIVEDEIGRMTKQLASGELDALATQGKFLELKYRGDEDMRDEEKA